MREKFESRGSESGTSAGPTGPGAAKAGRAAARSVIALLAILALGVGAVSVFRLHHEADVSPSMPDATQASTEPGARMGAGEASAMDASAGSPTVQPAGSPCLIDEGCSLESVGGGSVSGVNSAEDALGLGDAAAMNALPLVGVPLGEGIPAHAAKSACLASADCRGQLLAADDVGEDAPTPGGILLIADRGVLCGDDEDCADGSGEAAPLIVGLGRQPKLSPRVFLAANGPGGGLRRSSPSNVLDTNNSTGGGNTPAHIPTRGSVAGAIQRVAAATGEGGQQVAADLQDMPEPATLGLLALGLLGFGCAARRPALNPG